MSAAFITPLGIVIGFFFPTGLKFLIRRETHGGAPLAYAANGAASIIAPSLASLVAVTYGCNVLLALAAILYALAVVIIIPVVFRISRSSESS
jgi:dipeptide/tripeptide permease